MKRIIIVGIVVFIVVTFLITYRVRFTETAVVTTFGRATETPRKEPGLGFIVPYVQSVVKYDQRARYLESKPETQQTKDSRQVVVTAYLTWKVTDAKLFFQKFSGAGDRASNHYRQAERMLSDKLRSAMGEISQFQFDELASATDAGSKLGVCEERILKFMAGAGADSLHETTGITPVSVGIIGMELPEETSGKVFERMQANRSRIANDAISQGRAIAETIRSTARTDASIIVQFAESRAQLIRAEGDREAQKFFDQLKQEPELAVFIRNMEVMKDAFATSRVTLMIPGGPNGWPGFQLFQPGAMEELKSGKLPAFDPSRVPQTAPGARGGVDAGEKEKALASEPAAGEGDKR